MDTTPDHLLNRLVVAALTTFVVVVIFLAALVLRHTLLQQNVADLRDDVQVRLEELEETTDGIQESLQDLQTSPVEQHTGIEWEEISSALDEVDEQLGALEESLDEVTTILEPSAESIGIEESDEKVGMLQDAVSQVFTIFAVLVALASIGIALLLGMAIRIQQRIAPRERHTHEEPHFPVTSAK